MNPQSITTADGKNIVVKAIIRYKVDDTKAYLTTISQPQDVLIDTTQGIIREIIEDTHWNNIYELDSILTKKVSGFVKRWGIKVEKVTLTDLAQIQSIRIIQNKEEKQNIFPFTENIN
jgi:regulator of protease activity HflC (stomatin/prohibitin superfamily)